MKLVDCRGSGGPPRGSIYIGRAMPGGMRRGKYQTPLAASPLANPFRAKKGKGVGIPVASVLETYRRNLTWRLALGYGAPTVALRGLGAGSRLACWCASRDAEELTGEAEDAEGMCHGDVVYTVWLGCERLGWAWTVVDPLKDLCGFNRAHDELYESCFRQPLEWGRRAGGGR